MYKFLEEVAKNIEAEADAIEKYSELLAVADNEIDEFNDLEFVHSEIAEIISDELNHIDRLKRQKTKKRRAVIPPAVILFQNCHAVNMEKAYIFVPANLAVVIGLCRT